jgi:predicted nucleic-acid-binding Zn-ribbon protein
MSQRKECPKCRRSMQAGYVADASHGTVLVSSWYEGVPEKGLFGGLKLWGKPKTEITTYRCSSCGYLESYAVPS